VHKMQDERLGLGIKPKPKGIADDAWAKVLILTTACLTLLKSLTLLVFRAYK
jgi:hypothetical protein